MWECGENATSTLKHEILHAMSSQSLWLHENAHDGYSGMVVSSQPHGPTPMSTLNFHTPIEVKKGSGLSWRRLLTSFEVLGGIVQQNNSSLVAVRRLVHHVHL